jgi:hypothetical protein
MSGSYLDDPGAGGAAVAMEGGLVLGSTLGAQAGGYRADSYGRLSSTAAGALVGSLPFLVAAMEVVVSRPVDFPKYAAIGAIGAPVGAVIMNYRFRVPRLATSSATVLP